MKLDQYASLTGVKPVEFQRILKDQHGLDLNHETVRRWLNGTLSPAPKHMSVIEAATHGQVTRHDLRPDVFGPSPSADKAAPEVAADASTFPDRATAA